MGFLSRPEEWKLPREPLGGAAPEPQKVQAPRACAEQGGVSSISGRATAPGMPLSGMSHPRFAFTFQPCRPSSKTPPQTLKPGMQHLTLVISQSVICLSSVCYLICKHALSVCHIRAVLVLVRRGRQIWDWNAGHKLPCGSWESNPVGSSGTAARALTR